MGCELGMGATAALPCSCCEEASGAAGVGFCRGFMAISAVEERFCGRGIFFQFVIEEASPARHSDVAIRAKAVKSAGAQRNFLTTLVFIEHLPINLGLASGKS